MKHTLDAQGKKVGRLASEAAKLLIGKNTVEFARNIAPNVQVEIVNAAKADVNVKKMSEKLHPWYSGYPSGIKVPTVGQVIAKKGHKELFRQAIYGMLPHNKLRARMMKHLTITN